MYQKEKQKLFGKTFKSKTKVFEGVLIAIKEKLDSEDRFLIKENSGNAEWFNENDLELCGQN